MKLSIDKMAAVERIFERGTACDGCPHFNITSEPRGEFWGVPCSEMMASCAVLDQDVEPEQCPGLEEELTEMAAQALQEVAEEDEGDLPSAP